MPYVDLVADDDYVSIWYITNTPCSSVSTFDPNKPTVILLHPVSLDSSWLGNILGDPRLDDNYNMIAFDLRFSGKTWERPNGKLDCWVQAADLAFACDTLRIPPAHVWAEEAIAVNIALRFAIVFPEMCTSLCLVTCSPPAELQNVFAALDHAMRLWSFAEDLDALDQAAVEFLNLTVGMEMEVDEMDKIVAFWQIHYPPHKRVRVIGFGNTIFNRIPLTKSQLATINQPVLILHGENNTTHPVKYVQRLKENLVNSPEVILSVIRGASGYLSTTPSCASILNQIYAKFLGRLPRTPLGRNLPVIPDHMKRSLARLADLSGDARIADRNPSSVMSFSLVTPEIERGQTEAFALFLKGMKQAFSPLRPDGRPQRRFSERGGRHWFHGDVDGHSYAYSGEQQQASSQPSRAGSQNGGERALSFGPWILPHHTVFRSGQPPKPATHATEGAAYIEGADG
ncbi:alpha/beta-hydrolase [Gloeopeniophorella convolvens]|nr:alpha/beta-hydrolase [Gloeopeniophorella convolvens]